MLAWLIALQTPSPAAPDLIVSDFDLAKRKSVPTKGACGDGDGSEIVVCGRRIGGGGGNYPMEEMERRYRKKPLVAEVGIGPNATVRAYTESAEMQQGLISKRAMVGVKLKF